MKKMTEKGFKGITNSEFEELFLLGNSFKTKITDWILGKVSWPF